jgi:hypothetical protein
MTKQNDPMQQRIDQLEGLVKRLLAERQDISPSKAARGQGGQSGTEFVTSPITLDASDVASSPGTTVVDSASVYKGTDDWYDVLQEVRLLNS